ncbi:hypothetical protein CJF31_00008378 [Rutstroemia sp. NJR-2017a BVV2]|nr:hypothetical protein CJF31_00008378 [Rutstroemia sp. NJR-2017a BVV2]
MPTALSHPATAVLLKPA